MPDLPVRKVGIISCSGEELPEGTVARVATRLVLEDLRPSQAVTLCLPLFLAGGKEERAFARLYPTVAVDGCPKLCAARATATYSAEPAARVLVSEIASLCPGLRPESRRRLGPGGMALARRVAEEIAARVDDLLARPAMGRVVRVDGGAAPAPVCACQGGSLPARELQIGGSSVRLVALEPIFQQLGARAAPDEQLRDELLQAVKVYNAVPMEQEAAYAEALWREFVAYRTAGGLP